MWLSLVERLVRDQEVASSNLVTPIFQDWCYGSGNLLAMYFVYVLRSEKTGRRYIGSCEDLRDRFRRHNNGESKATEHGVPWRLVHREEFPTRTEAVRRERYFKTGKGRDELVGLESVVFNAVVADNQPA